jgi:hypothetical protein
VKPDWTEVVPHFCFEGDFVKAEPIPSGHINDSYAAWFRKLDGSLHRYLLQRINHHVFRSPERLMANIAGITGHLRQKIVAGGGDPLRETITLIPCVYGSSFYQTMDGDYWRAALYIEGARTYDVVQDLSHVYSAAKAFGNFQRLVSDFPVGRLHETISDFHNTPKRFDAFVAAVERDARNRAASVRAEIEFVERRAGMTSILVDLMEQGLLPRRVTHNDTKFNNVLIDDVTGKGICVIDLDTVMPGLSLYDFGDAVRSGANSAAEDERDLSQVTIDLDIFERFTTGYLDAARDFLTPLEIDHLPFSAQLMTMECGMRFLTDHLNGDLYFRTLRPNHNLDRCRTQFKMVQDMEARFDDMLNIVASHRSSPHP